MLVVKRVITPGYLLLCVFAFCFFTPCWLLGSFPLMGVFLGGREAVVGVFLEEGRLWYRVKEDEVNHH